MTLASTAEDFLETGKTRRAGMQRPDLDLQRVKRLEQAFLLGHDRIETRHH